MTKNPIEGVEIKPSDSDIAQWDIVVDGPEGTPFVGGKFVVHLDFS